MTADLRDFDETAPEGDPESAPAKSHTAFSNPARTVLWGTLTNYLQWGVKLVAAMILVRINIDYLDDDYDFWAFVWSIFSAVFLLDFGLGFSLARFVPPAYGKGDIGEVRRIISAVFWFFMGGAVVIAVAGGVATVVLPGTFEVFLDHHRIPFLVFAGFMSINFPTNLFRDCLFALDRLAMRNVLGILVDLATLGTLILLYSLGFGLLMIVIVMGTAILVRNLLCLLVVWRTLGAFPLIPRPSLLWEVREMLSFSLYTYVTSFSNLFLKTGAVTVLGFFAAVGAGPYNPARTLATYFEDFVQQLLMVLPPLIGRLTGEAARQAEIFVRLSRFVLCFASVVYVPLILHIDPLFRAWVPNLPLLDTAIGVARILLTKAFAVVVLLGPAQSVLLIAGKHRPVARATTLSAGLAFVLSIPGWYWLGLLGVAVAFATGPIVGGLLLLPVGWRFAEISPGVFARRVVVPFLLPCALLLGILLGGLALGWDGLLGRILTSIAAVLVFAATYLAVGVEDRVLVRSLLERLRG